MGVKGNTEQVDAPDWDDEEVLAYLFRTAQVNGKLNEQYLYPILRDGWVTAPRLSELMKQHQTLFDKVAPLYPQEGMLHTPLALVTKQGQELLVNRATFTTRGVVLVQIVRDAENGVEAQALLKTAISVFKEMARPVAGAYVLAVSPFAITSIAA
jgi:hypothetical protein